MSRGCSTPVSIHLLDLGSILVAYMQVQHTHLRHHATPLKCTYKGEVKYGNEIEWSDGQ